MGKLSGAVLIVAGVAVAAYALPGGQHRGAESAGPAARPEVKASVRPSTGDPPEGQAKAAGAATDKPQPATAAPPPTPPPPAAKSHEPMPNRPALTDKVVPPPSPLRIAEAPPRVPVDHGKAAAAAPLDKDRLTREIQRQLKRVGCYGGAITGAWSPAVRQAMKAFTDRVYAALPVEQPDQILLALVQSQQEVICGSACPPGQAAGHDGRCLPKALVARAKKPNAWAKEASTIKAPAPAYARGPAAAPAPPTPPTNPPPTGRMSLAGPAPSDHRPARSKAATTHRKHARRYVPAARPSHYAEDRTGYRRRSARAPSGPATGFPWWAVPLFSP